MRKGGKVVIGGREIEILELTLAEIKQLWADGITIGRVKNMSEDDIDEVLEKVFAIACPGFNADTLTFVEALELVYAIMDLSYGGGKMISSRSDSLH